MALRAIHSTGMALALATCVSAASAHAQVSTGGVRGIVHDESGAILPGATVEAQSPARIGGALTAVSDGQGAYRSRTCRSASTASPSRSPAS